MLEGDIHVKKYEPEGLVIFSFVGDFVDPDYIVKSIKPSLKGFKNIVLDVQNLEYINSACFGTFYELAAQIEQSKTNVCFLNPNKKFKIIYDSLGASAFFPVITSLNEL